MIRPSERARPDAGGAARSCVIGGCWRRCGRQPAPKVGRTGGVRIDVCAGWVRVLPWNFGYSVLPYVGLVCGRLAAFVSYPLAVEPTTARPFSSLLSVHRQRANQIAGSLRHRTLAVDVGGQTLRSTPTPSRGERFERSSRLQRRAHLRATTRSPSTCVVILQPNRSYLAHVSRAFGRRLLSCLRRVRLPAISAAFFFPLHRYGLLSRIVVLREDQLDRSPRSCVARAEAVVVPVFTRNEIGCIADVKGAVGA